MGVLHHPLRSVLSTVLSHPLAGQGYKFGDGSPWLPPGSKHLITLPLLTDRYGLYGSEDATLARNTAGTVIDHEGIVRTVQLDEFRFSGSRRNENLMPDPANPITRTVSGLGIGRYTFAVRGGTGNVVLSGDAVDTCNPQEGFVFTLSAVGSVTFTVNGIIDSYQLELTTDQANDAPSEFVSENDSCCSERDISVRCYAYENGGSWV